LFVFVPLFREAFEVRDTVLHLCITEVSYELIALDACLKNERKNESLFRINIQHRMYLLGNPRKEFSR
jgi:hypothetical protein